MQQLKAQNSATCISNSQPKTIYELATEHFAHAVITVAAPQSWLTAYGGDAVYVGESRDLGRRLPQHAGDETKAFVSEVFFITSIKQHIEKAAGNRIPASVCTETLIRR